jgi:fluoroquinolone resistance protein
MTTRELLTAETQFDRIVFEGLDLHGFDFAGKEFQGCTFRSSKLGETGWRGARLEDCVFERCDLTRMRPNDMRCHGVEFRGCKLMGVEWTRASLRPQLSFEECMLRYASFVGINLRGTRLLRCQAPETQFVDVDLTDADFSETDLSGAVFQGATLAGADFWTARGATFDPAKNRVKGAHVSVETAMSLAASFGMKVSAKPPAKASRARR